jgi:hypothetical protein
MRKSEKPTAGDREANQVSLIALLQSSQNNQCDMRSLQYCDKNTFFLVSTSREIGLFSPPTK